MLLQTLNAARLQGTTGRPLTPYLLPSWLPPYSAHCTDSSAQPLLSHSRQRNRGCKSCTSVSGGKRSPWINPAGGMNSACRYLPHSTFTKSSGWRSSTRIDTKVIYWAARALGTLAACDPYDDPVPLTSTIKPFVVMCAITASPSFPDR